jgi:hypothetical protein
MREDRFIVIALLLLFQAELFSCSKNHNTVTEENKHLETTSVIAVESVVPERPLSAELTALCLQVTELHNYMISGDSDDYRNGRRDWDRDMETIENSLLIFFRTKESLDADMSYYLPFVSCLKSKDGRIRVYSWEPFDDGGLDSVNTTIIQYITAAKNPEAVMIDDVIENDTEEWNHPMIYMGYGVIGNIKDSVYILQGGRQAGWHGVQSGFITFQLKDDELMPYYAFNGSMSFYFSWYSPRDDLEGIIDYRLNFDNEPFKISFVYNETEKNGNIARKTMEFIFDGAVFAGDYETFREIEKIPW